MSYPVLFSCSSELCLLRTFAGRRTDAWVAEMGPSPSLKTGVSSQQYLCEQNGFRVSGGWGCVVPR